MDAYKPQPLKELFVDTSSKSVKDFEKWLFSMRKKNGEKYIDSTIERYATFIKRYEKTFISSKLTTTQLNDLMTRVNGSVLYSAIKAWLKFNGYDEDLDKQLFSLIKKPTKHANMVSSERFLRSKILSREELVALIQKEKNDFFKELYMFSYDTACRRAEIFKAKWKNVYVFDPTSLDADEKEMFDKGIRAQIRILGKGRKWRTVYIYKKTFEMMFKRMAFMEMDQAKKDEGDFPIYKMYQKDGYHVYKNPEHQYYKHLCEHAQNVLVRDVHPHCFRHTQATHMADRGCSVHKILAYIGDSDIRMGGRYVDISTFDSKHGFMEYSRPLFD